MYRIKFITLVHTATFKWKDLSYELEVMQKVVLGLIV